MAATGVPGIALGLVYQDQVVFERGYGVRKEGEPEAVDADTVFQLASLSKSVSSSGVAALVGDGVIGWDDPVQPHLPGFTLADPWVGEHVTFADLYSHRSGLPGGAGDSLEWMGYSRDEVIERLRLEPLRPFRATYGYSNFGMTVAGDAAGKAYGPGFEQLMDDLLFDPAGMEHTSARYDDFLAEENRAAIHARIDGRWVPDFPRMPDAQAPAGGITSSISDLMRWARLELGGGMLDGEEVVDEAALAQTHTPHILNHAPGPIWGPSGFYGLGWNVGTDHLGHTRWNHSGAFTNGAATTVVLIPEAQLGIVVLTNGMPIGVPEGLSYGILDRILVGHETKDWLDHFGTLFAGLFVGDPALETPPTDPAPARADDAYVGTYANDYYGAFDVVASDDGLQIVMGPARLTFPLTHRDGDVFTYVPYPELPDIAAAITFAGDDGGVDGGGRAAQLTVSDLDGTGLGTLTRA
jgi:CubicO group peptidase (beta-lactamase class C family)